MLGCYIRSSIQVVIVVCNFNMCVCILLLLLYYCGKIYIMWGFPGGAVVENLPANAGDTGSSPGLGRSHMLRSN